MALDAPHTKGLQKYYAKFAFIQIRNSMGAHLIFFIIFTLFSCIILTNQSLPWYSLRSGFQCDTKMAAVFSCMRPVPCIHIPPPHRSQQKCCLLVSATPSPSGCTHTATSVPYPQLVTSLRHTHPASNHHTPAPGGAGTPSQWSLCLCFSLPTTW